VSQLICFVMMLNCLYGAQLYRLSVNTGDSEATQMTFTSTNTHVIISLFRSLQFWGEV